MANHTRITLHALHQDTARLTDAAGEMGDTFLQYLYGMVLIYLHDRIRGGQREESTVEVRDPQIQLAASLIVRGEEIRPPG